MSWLFLHYFSVLSTSWLFLFFFLLSVLFKFCLAAAALFGTSIVNCASLCCVSVGIFSLSFTAWPSLLPTLLLWWSILWTHPHCFLPHWYYWQTCDLLWQFLCFSFFNWNSSSSSKIYSHGMDMFLCSTLLFFPS